MLHRPDHHASLHNGEFHDLIHLKLSLTGNGGGQADAEAVARTRQTDGGQGAHRQRHHPLREGELRPGGRGGAERRRTRPAAEALPPAPRCLPRAARRSGVCPPQPPPHADQRLDQSPGSPMRQGPVRVLRGGLLLGKSRTNGPWRWTTSCPGTKAVPTTSATCRPSASAAMPASAMLFADARGHHRLPRSAGQLRPARGRLCVLRAGAHHRADGAARDQSAIRS